MKAGRQMVFKRSKGNISPFTPAKNMLKNVTHSVRVISSGMEKSLR